MSKDDAFDPLDFDAVHDKESFLAFVTALAEDRRNSVGAEAASPSSPYGPNAGRWENITVEDFLEAAVRCEDDHSKGSDRAGSDEAIWKWFASFLYGGKVYE